MSLYYHHHRRRNIPRTHITRRCLGVSLVQVLVSLTLSMLLLTIALYWYPILKGALISDRKKRHELDIGRTTLHFLSQDLNACGYRGYRSRDNHLKIHRAVVDFASPYRFIRTDRLVFGFFVKPGLCPLYLPTTACERLQANSDVLMIYNIPKKSTFLKQDLSKTDEIIVTESESGIQKHSVILLADCLQADLMVATAVDKANIYHQRAINVNTTPYVSKLYRQGSEITELQTVAYYLGKPKRALDKNPVSFSLYRDDIVHKAVEVIEGITKFEVRYGILETGKPIHYQKAEVLSEDLWRKVGGVQIKIITEMGKVLEYEISFRNRLYFN